MKVSNKSSNPLGSSAETAKSKSVGSDLAAKKGAAKSSGLEDLGGASKVDISTRAQDIKKAKELATPSNDIDEAKVARLQKLIDEGKYKVDAEAIADRMVDEHLNMPS